MAVSGKTPEDDGANIALEAFRRAERRKHLLFLGVSVFLIINALCFFILLFCSFWLVAMYDKDWRIFLAAVIPAAIGAIISVMALRAIYQISGKNESIDYETPITKVKNWLDG